MVEDCAPDVVKVVEGDALSIDYAALLRSSPPSASPPSPPPPLLAGVPPGESPQQPQQPHVHVVGNLPFNIATPLLMRFLRMADQRSGLFQDGPAAMTLCFQKEVAQRMAAPPDTRLRSRLSVMAQHYCDVERRFILPGHVFVPPPKVDAEVVHLRGKADLRTPVSPPFFDLLEETAKLLFHHRRKVLHHAARNLVAAARADAPSLEAGGAHGDDGVPRPLAARVRSSSLASSQEAQAFVALCGLPPDARPFKLSGNDVVHIAELFGRLKALGGDVARLQALCT